MSEPVYECDSCGACCKKQLVELCVIDLEREPLLRPLARSCTVTVQGGQDGRQTLGSYPAQAMPTDGPGGACRFLADPLADPLGQRRCLCAIYPTRPGACVLVPAGGPKCQDERRKQGLPPLPPKEAAA